MQFRAVKQHLGGHQFHSSDEVEMAACEWLPVNGCKHNSLISKTMLSFKLMLRLDKRVNVFVAYIEK
jgi:hypothetical protein